MGGSYLTYILSWAYLVMELSAMRSAVMQRAAQRRMFSLSVSHSVSVEISSYRRGMGALSQHDLCLGEVRAVAPADK